MVDRWHLARYAISSKSNQSWPEVILHISLVLLAITSIRQGGVQEVLMLNPDMHHEVLLYLKNRKGFIKLALTTGSPVVPVFAFNLDGSYRYWLPRGPLVEKISRAIGFAPLVFIGRWGVPFGIPIPRKSHVVIGQGT